MKWIKYADKKPGKYGIVLGYDAQYDVVHICSRNNYTGGRRLLPVDSSDDVDITHWMPMPPSPEED